MPLSRATAQQLMAAIESCGMRLFAVLPALEQELTPEEFAKMRHEISAIISTMDSSISVHVAHAHPDIAPQMVPWARPI